MSARGPVLLLAAAAALSGCHAPAAAAPPAPVVIAQSATANEPRGQLSTQVRRLLRTAAETTRATDGVDGDGATVLLATADGRPPRRFPLTPRRADGKVEHGLRRAALVDANLDGVAAAVAGTAAERSGVDGVEELAEAVRGLAPGTLVVLGSGLSTAGGLDLRRVGWHADAADVAAQLGRRRLLPDLTGWTVVFSGLGSTAGPQDPLPSPARVTLEGYWTAICRAAGAAECRVDGERLAGAAPVATVPTPAVPVEGVTSVTGPGGRTTTTIADAVLGFAPDSATLGHGADEVLAAAAARIDAALADDPGAVVTVRGWTANPPGATPEHLVALSRARAQAVADGLRRAGLTHPVAATGGGAAPSPDAMAGGSFDEAVAVRMRRSEISY